MEHRNSYFTLVLIAVNAQSVGCSQTINYKDLCLNLSTHGLRV